MKMTYILGPCAAETHEQVWNTAVAITALKKKMDNASIIFRAGIWKPRTNPNSFQGIGSQGLRWLQEVEEKLALPTATEVATPEQMRLALEAQLSHLWIGARTVANPIQVQELADALNDYLRNHPRYITIYVKNPVNEDAQLWAGNIRRMQNALGEHGEVVAIHRGCGHRPKWEMPYFLRHEMPEVNIILDPSHMAGCRERIPTCCQQGQNLGLDGYMIEVHPQPDNALSDGPQQLTPQAMEELIGHMQARKDYDELIWLRTIMDEVDDELWQVVAHRMDVSRAIGDYKKKRGMEVVQPSRYQDILQRRLAWANTHHLSAECVEQMMDTIHQESIRHQA